MLPEHLFLQNIDTENKYHLFCSKIRDSRTTYIESDKKNIRMNHGVFIDVIPLDRLPDDRFFSVKYRIFRICQLMYLQSDKRYKNFIKCILKPFINIKFVYRRFEKYLEGSINSKNEYCNFHNAKNLMLSTSADVYGVGESAEFEGVQVIVPEKYDEYLTSYYGDWRAELPPEQQVGHHYCEICDTKKPYSDYVEAVSQGKIKLKLP